MAALLGLKVGEALPEFLNELAAAPYVPGDWDCAMATANWVRHVTGVDPAASIRRSYSDRKGWERLVESEGGLVPLMDRLAIASGLERVIGPVAGDIGTVLVRGVEGSAGAIRAARGWVVKTENGIRMSNAMVPICAWGWRCRQ